MLNSIGLLTLINIFLVFSGVLNSIVLANLFGTSRTLEIYFAVMVLFNVVVRVSQVGQLAEVFLPTYHHTKFNVSLQKAREEFSVVLNWMFIFSLVIVAPVFLFVPLLVDLLMPGFSYEDKQLGQNILYLVTPLIIIQVTIGILKILINAEEMYVNTDIVDVLSKFAGIVSIIGAYSSYGVFSLVIALWLGMSIRFFGVCCILYKHGFKHRLLLKSKGFSFLSIYKKVVKLYAYVGATQFFLVTFTASMSFMPQGTYAVFKYVENIYATIGGVVVRPVGIVFFTNFSKMYSKGSKEVSQLAEKALAYVLLTLFLIIAGFMYSLDGFLNVLWGSDNFDSEKISLAVKLLMFLLVLVLIDGLNIVGRRIVVSVGLIDKQYIFTTIAQIFSAIYAYFVIREYGVTGAVSVLVFNAIALGMVPILLIRLYASEFKYRYPPKLFVKWFVSLAVSFLVCSTIEFTIKDFGAAGKLNILIQSIVKAGLAVSLLVLVAWLLKVKEVVDLWHYLSSKLRRTSEKST